MAVNKTPGNAQLPSRKHKDKMKRFRVQRLAAVCVLLIGYNASCAVAQTAGGEPQGQRRIQGAPVQKPAPAPIELGTLVNYREEMRQLIQRIGEYARTLNPQFAIVPSGGLELLEKIDEVYADKTFPARGYMRSINGLMRTAVYYGWEEIDKATPEAIQEEFLRFAEIVRSNGIRFLSMDFATTPGKISRALRLANQRDFAAFVADKYPDALNSLPRFPERPNMENPKNVLSLKDVRNFLYIADGSGLGREDEFALRIQATNYDLVVTDIFHGRKPLSRRALETMKYKKLGARRLVFARMDIGAAATYRYYWQRGWKPGAPSWVTSPYPTDPDRFFVEYWDRRWHNLLYGNSDSYIYGLVRHGFDGVVLEGVDAFKFVESDGVVIEGFH